jgi:hypothetical protein
LKKIKDQIMLRFFSKVKEADEMCGTICPKIRKKLDRNIDFANNYDATPAAKHLFNVIGLYGEYEVRIDKMECSCRAWQLSGIPCRHACAAFRAERIKPESVVHKCYSIEAFKATYSEVIMPCSDPRMWKKMNGPPIRPPKYDKQVGRPSKKRRKSALEEDGGTRLSRHGIIGHCSVCNKTDHNKRKCTALGRGAAQQQAPDAAPGAHQQAPDASGPEQQAPDAAPGGQQQAPDVADKEAPYARDTEAPAAAPVAPEHAQPPKKMLVRRKSSDKVHQRNIHLLA